MTTEEKLKFIIGFIDGRISETTDSINNLPNTKGGIEHKEKYIPILDELQFLRNNVIRDTLEL